MKFKTFPKVLVAIMALMSVLLLGAIPSLIAAPSLVGAAFSDQVDRENSSGKGVRLLYFDGSVFINVFGSEDIYLESGAGEAPEKDYHASVFMAVDQEIVCDDFDVPIEPDDFKWNFGKATLHLVGNDCGEIDITWDGIRPTRAEKMIESFDVCEELGFIVTFAFNGQFRDAIATGTVNGFTFDTSSDELVALQSFIDNGQGWFMFRQCSP